MFLEVTVSLLIALDRLDFCISLFSALVVVGALQSLLISHQFDEDVQMSCLQKSKMPAGVQLNTDSAS